MVQTAVEAPVVAMVGLRAAVEATVAVAEAMAMEVEATVEEAGGVGTVEVARRDKEMVVGEAAPVTVAMVTGGGAVALGGMAVVEAALERPEVG